MKEHGQIETSLPGERKRGSPENAADPLEQLLSETFARALDNQPDMDIVARVLARISLEQRVRSLALGAVLALGVILGATTLLPVLNQVGATIQLPASLPATLAGVGPLLLLFLASWWLLVDETF